MPGFEEVELPPVSEKEKIVDSFFEALVDGVPDLADGIDLYAFGRQRSGRPSSRQQELAGQVAPR